MANSNQENSDGLTGERLLAHLKSALASDGDFPVRARVVSELRTLANDPQTPIERISEVILREPSLGTRVLHIVNSGFYRRSRAIITVSDAVMQIGMRTLVDTCTGMVVLHKFVPGAKRGDIFADNLKRTILNSLATSSLAMDLPEKGIAERGYLAGTFYSMGYLLLAYYCPQLYEVAGKRARSRGHSLAQSISELLGVSPIQLNLIILEALEIPAFYRDILTEAAARSKTQHLLSPNAPMVNCLLSAGWVSDALVDGIEEEPFVQGLHKLCRQYNLSFDAIVSVCKNLPPVFRQHCEMIELGFLKLPAYLESETFGSTPEEPAQADGASEKAA